MSLSLGDVERLIASWSAIGDSDTCTESEALLRYAAGEIKT